jgi:hypothetical protein
MSDPGRPLGSRLKGKFKALYDQLGFSESRRPFNENLSTGLRLGFTSISVHLMLIISLEGIPRLRRKAQLWCMSTLWVKQSLLLIFYGTLECIAGSSQLCY